MFEIETANAPQLQAAIERALSAIGEVADLLAADVVGTCPDSSLTSLVSDLAEIEDRAAACGSVAVARLDRSGIVRADGYLSTRAWMDTHLRNPRRENLHILRTARLLNRWYPATHRAWLGHVITRAHADVIGNGIEAAVKGLDPDLRDQARTDAEQVLLDISTDQSPDVARNAVTRIRLAADPDGAKAAAVEADGKQWFSLTAVSDGWLCKGWLDTITGTALATALEGRRASRHHTGTSTQTHSWQAAWMSRTPTKKQPSACVMKMPASWGTLPTSYSTQMGPGASMVSDHTSRSASRFQNCQQEPVMASWSYPDHPADFAQHR